MSRRGSKRTVPGGEAEAALRNHERALLWGIRIGIGVILLAPLIVTTEIAFSFIVGKTLLCRSAIEIVFALWALLVVGNPRFRPPRSRLLALLGIGLLWSLIAAFLGADWQRSLWSNYEHMQGVVDSAHWLAFLVVLLSVCRDMASLRIFLNINLGVGILVALLAIALGLDWQVPFYGDLLERDVGRIGVPLGNAVYLGAYAMMNCLLALILLAHSFGARAQQDGSAPPSGRLAARAFWALAAALNFCVWPFTDSTSALLGLVGALAALAFLYMLLAPPRARWRLAAALSLVAAVAAGSAFVVYGAQTDQGVEHNGLLHDLRATFYDLSARSRLAAWRSGLVAFAEHPIAGIGPDNFGIAFAQHAQIEPKMEYHTYAHASLVEAAVTQGSIGLALHVALWVFAFGVIWRSTRRTAPKQRIFTMFVGAALASYFVQIQLQPSSVAVTLQFFLLLAIVIRLEAALPKSSCEHKAAGRFPAASAAWRTALGHVAIRTALAAAALGVSVGGLIVSQSMFVATRAFHSAIAGSATFRESVAHFKRAIEAFEPMASEPRLHFLHALLNNWPFLRMRQVETARQLLAYANAEAAAALAAEPENWLVHRTLGAFYQHISLTEPEYAALARYHAQRTVALAPEVHKIQEW